MTNIVNLLRFFTGRTRLQGRPRRRRLRRNLGQRIDVTRNENGRIVTLTILIKLNLGLNLSLLNVNSDNFRMKRRHL